MTIRADDLKILLAGCLLNDETSRLSICGVDFLNRYKKENPREDKEKGKRKKERDKKEKSGGTRTCFNMPARLGICAQMFLSKMVCTRTKTLRCLVSMPNSLALR